jgi:hypothetical protein
VELTREVLPGVRYGVSWDHEQHHFVHSLSTDPARMAPTGGVIHSDYRRNIGRDSADWVFGRADYPQGLNRPPGPERYEFASLGSNHLIYLQMSSGDSEFNAHLHLEDMRFMAVRLLQKLHMHA